MKISSPNCLWLRNVSVKSFIIIKKTTLIEEGLDIQDVHLCRGNKLWLDPNSMDI